MAGKGRTNFRGGREKTDEKKERYLSHGRYKRAFFGARSLIKPRHCEANLVNETGRKGGKREGKNGVKERGRLGPLLVYQANLGWGPLWVSEE